MHFSSPWMCVHISHIRSFRLRSFPSATSSASDWMSVLVSSLTAIVVPRLLVTYWLTAGCVMPRRSEIHIWERPSRVSSFATSERMVGRICQTAASQGDRCVFMIRTQEPHNVTFVSYFCPLRNLNGQTLDITAPYKYYNNCYKSIVV